MGQEGQVNYWAPLFMAESCFRGGGALVYGRGHVGNLKASDLIGNHERWENVLIIECTGKKGSKPLE